MTLDIFRCHDARLHTLPEAPTLRVANHEQLVAHRNNLEALNADKIVPRFGTDPDQDDECKFFEWCCYSMLAEEDFWRQAQLVWAWIDEKPVWLSPVNWTGENEWGVLSEPKTPILRRFRLALLGGGQIRVSEQFEPMGSSPEDKLGGVFGFICYQPTLRITTDAGDGLRHFTGVIGGVTCEMGAKTALFTPGTPQSVADRVAATFRLLTRADCVGTSACPPDRDNFMALLDRSESCCVCNRTLRDHVSTLLGIGPDCARQMGLPHNLDAANRVLQRRRELLGVKEEAAS